MWKTKTYVKIVVMENNKPKCHWCSNQATRIDYRCIDGMTSKLVSCDKCFTIATKVLLKKVK